SGVEHVSWLNSEKARRVECRGEHGPDRGREKTPSFRPKDESQEEVERARLAAVEALRRLERGGQPGRLRAGGGRRGQSGVRHASWVNGEKARCVGCRIGHGPDRGRKKTPSFRPKGESPEEAERARLAAVEALRRLERGGQLGRPRAGDGHPGRRGQSGVERVRWVSREKARRAEYRARHGPDRGRKKTPPFRPKDESPEEVERAPLAAVEVLRRLERGGQLGRPRAGDGRPGRRGQSGVEHVISVNSEKARRVEYRIRHGPDRGREETPSFRPKDESHEEAERARLAAVEALRRLEWEDQPERLRAGGGHRGQSGVNHVSWVNGEKARRVEYRIRHGPDRGHEKALSSRPKDVSPEEVGRAGLAAVEALRRLQEEEGERLSAFRRRYPVGDGAVGLLARQPAEV
ncbi:unnamed protein product, partial [Prorocentrum cordatum]